MSAPIDSVDSSSGPRASIAPSGSGRLLLLAGIAGVVAGLVAWLVGETLLQVFVPKTMQVAGMGAMRTIVEYHEGINSEYKNAIIAYSILGASLGLFLGLAGGLARRVTPAAIRAGMMGIILGALLAGGAAAAILPVYYHQHEFNQEQLSQDLLLPLLIHAGSWAAAGLAGGLALGLGLGADDRGGRARLFRAALGGLIGAIVGAVVYELIGGIAFTADRSGEPVSRTAATRFIARMAVALFAALTAALMAESKPKRVITSTPNLEPTPTPSQA